MSTKRPRTELSLCKKYDIVKELNGGAKQADVAKKYGINESTVSRIKKERQSISKKFETGEKNPKQKRNRNIGFAGKCLEKTKRCPNFKLQLEILF